MSQNESRGPLAEVLDHRPPPELEQRVLETLRSRGLIAPRPVFRRTGRVWRTGLMIAAGIALFVAGAFSQRMSAPDAPAIADLGPRYALLLYGAQTESAEAERARVDEYRRWLRAIAADGRYVAGEKLRPGALELTSIGAVDSATTDSEALAGFFIVSASTPAEAESIARSCPHIRHGGKVVLRAIDPT